MEHESADDILQSLAENAANVCGAYDAVIDLVDGDVLRRVAHHGPVPSRLAVIPINRETMGGIVIPERRVVQVEDALTCAFPLARMRAEQDGVRSQIAAPLLRGDTAIGMILIRRLEPGPFSDRQVELLQTFAGLAVIALENRRLLAEVETKNQELAESLEHQTATAEVLKVIANSPTELQPVLDTIAESATHVAAAVDATIYLVNGNLLDEGAAFGPVEGWPPPHVIRHDGLFGRVVLERRTIHVPDCLAQDEFPVTRAVAQRSGNRTALVIPLQREGMSIGILVVRRVPVNPFADKEIQLLETFADQAVIAIENARLFRELNERNAELRAALDRQTVTAEVLQIISRSPTELQPVLDAIARNAAQVCAAYDVVIRLVQGDQLYEAAHFGDRPTLRGRINPSPEGMFLPAIKEKRTLAFADAQTQTEYPVAAAAARQTGTRSSLVVPLVRGENAVGLIQARRTEVKPFSAPEVALLQTFASQAVIAMENARLFDELRESLEQQIAMSEVLGIIASSPTDVQPVLEAVARVARQVNHSSDVTITLVSGDALRIAAHTGPVVPGLAPGQALPLDDTSVMGRSILARKTVRVDDMQSLPAGHPIRDRAAAVGFRSNLSTPLLREGIPIGAIGTAHAEVRHFTEREIALFETFAAQAVIAIENARLFREINERNAELREALDRQTSTSEVLRIISSSPTELQPVFDAIAEAAVRLLDAHTVSVWTSDGRDMELVAHHSLVGAASLRIVGEVGHRRPVSRDSGTSAIALLERRTVHIPDIESLGDQDYGRLKARGKAAGFGAGSLLATPMWWEGEPAGAIVVTRLERRPFTDPEIALLETFASQAVIAMQNVRLFRELEAKNAELEVASQHKSDFLSHMSHELRTPLNAILSFSEMLQEDAADANQEQFIPDLEEIHTAGTHLLALINDILDLSKIEAGKMELSPEDFPVGELVHEVQRMAQPLAERNGNLLEVTCPEDIGSLHADRMRVRQCLLNLLSNAAKFTERGRINLDVAREQADRRAALRFTVSDTGVGMTEEQIGRLFEAFSQAEATTSRTYGGTGLGLAITRQFCEMMGGYVTVKSEPGMGSSFRIVLPADSRAVGAPA